MDQRAPIRKIVLRGGFGKVRTMLKVCMKQSNISDLLLFHTNFDSISHTPKITHLSPISQSMQLSNNVVVVLCEVIDGKLS